MDSFVLKVQKVLNKLGAGLVVDGIRGPKTDAALDAEAGEVSAPPASGAKFHEPTFVVHKDIKFDTNGKYKTPTGKFIGLTVHYTVSGDSPRGVLGWLAEQGYGCMVMGHDGSIHIPAGFDIFTDWNDHSGKSKWRGLLGVSKYYAGMEICCWGKDSKVGPFRESKGEANIIPGKYQQFTKEQEEELTNFILWAKSKNPDFNLDNVVGHDELRTEYGLKGDKQDPGASLSMTMPEYREKLKSL